jgi:hypothetical protein
MDRYCVDSRRRQSVIIRTFGLGHAIIAFFLCMLDTFTFLRVQMHIHCSLPLMG